jgi:hypothetical protein
MKFNNIGKDISAVVLAAGMAIGCSNTNSKENTPDIIRGKIVDKTITYETINQSCNVTYQLIEGVGFKVETKYGPKLINVRREMYYDVTGLNTVNLLNKDDSIAYKNPARNENRAFITLIPSEVIPIETYK